MDASPDPRSGRQALREARRQFQQRFDVMATAYSTDGRTFAFQAPLGLAIRLGGYVRLEPANGPAWLGQVLEREVLVSEGAEVRVAGTENANARMADLGISVSEATVRLKRHHVRGSGILLGRIVGDEILPPGTDASASGFDDADIVVPDAADLERSFAAWRSARPTLPIGTAAAADHAVAATIDASGFNRHTFLCGQSGSGKTYSLGVVLEQLLLGTDLRIAILDPNADYVRLGDLREAGAGDEELQRRYLERVAGLQVYRPEAGDGNATGPLRVRFSDLSRDDQARTLRLDPLADREEYDAFWSMVARAGQAAYGLEDVQRSAQHDLSESTRQVLLRIANLGVAGWPIWAGAGQPSLADALDGAWRALVLDLSRFESLSERSVAALATLRHFWRHRESRQPVLLVVDEAHNVCPYEPEDAIQAAATEVMISIAGEGRKYGIYLFLATQRPDKLHPNVISQCDNLMLMRMNSQVDLARLGEIFSFVPRDLLAEASTFRQGEALLAGKIVPSPLLVRMGQRLSAEGGVDVPTTWAAPAQPG